MKIANTPLRWEYIQIMPKTRSIDYIRPQANGNRTDARWIKLTDENGNGVVIEGLQPLELLGNALL